MAEQSNLERLAIQEREQEIINNHYNSTPEGQYSSQHPDALSPESPNASGEEKGKGTNSSVGTLPLTHVKDPHSPIVYSNIVTNKGGDPVDIETRKRHILRNLYDEDNQYGVNSVDTSRNVADGQYVVR